MCFRLRDDRWFLLTCFHEKLHQFHSLLLIYAIIFLHLLERLHLCLLACHCLAHHFKLLLQKLLHSGIATFGNPFGVFSIIELLHHPCLFRWWWHNTFNPLIKFRLSCSFYSWSSFSLEQKDVRFRWTVNSLTMLVELFKKSHLRRFCVPIGCFIDKGNDIAHILRI